MKKFVQQYIAYVKDNPERYWFKRRLFGWGWVPATKEGWLVILGYLILILLLALTLDETSTDKEAALMFLLPLVILTALLIRICYKKGERPKWSWGIPEKYKK